MSIDRRNTIRSSGKSLVLIGGQLYRTSSTTLRKAKSQPAMASKWFRNKSDYFYNGRSSWNLKAVKAHERSRSLVNQALNRSLASLSQKKQDPAMRYCIYYNRFGRCNRGQSCQYVHDPEKIAVCTRFLRGTCKVENCPFSHKVSKDKMPTCSYFMRGRCNKDDCPYLHVNVGQKALVCQNFLNGFCPNGEKCKKLHTLECQDYRKTGACPNDAACKLRHFKIPAVQKPSHDYQKARKPSAVPVEMADVIDTSLPFKNRKLPAFISLSANQSGESQAIEPPREDDHILIKPRLSYTPQEEFCEENDSRSCQ